MSGQHLDLDALADLLVGEGDAAAVAHVGACTACSSALADLDAAQPALDALLRDEAARPLPPPPVGLVPGLLAALPAPEPAAPVRTGAGGSGSTVLPGASVTRFRSRPARRSPLLAVAAAGVALLALVGLGVGLARGGSTSSDDASTSAVAASPAADLPVLATGADYTDAASVARLLPRLLGTTTGDAAAGAGGASGGTASGLSGAPAQAAPAPVPSAAARSTAPLSGVPAGAAPSRADPLARLRDPVQLAGCLGELTGPDADVVPLALDYARYRGQPAVVVVLPSAKADKVDVFVVGAGCTAGDDQTLFFTRQPRA